MEQTTILLITLGILIIIAIITKLILKSKIQKQENSEEARESESMQEYDLQNFDNIPQALEELRNISKKFFKSYLDISKEKTYMELAEKFRELKKEDFAEFCEDMDYLLYSGVEVSKNDLVKALDEFILLTKKAQIEAKEKREE